MAKMSKELVELLSPTPAEKLLIWRKREGLNQVQAANVKEVHVDLYRAWERGQKTKGCPVFSLKNGIARHEACVLLRRRNKMTQAEVAKAIGVRRNWIIRMEEGKGQYERLCDFWEI